MSEIQSGIEVDNDEKAVTGTLAYYDDATKALVIDWGAGNFIGVHFVADDWSDYTSVKVGLNPSEGTGLLEILDDADKAAVMQINDKDEQVIKIVATNGTQTVTAEYDLSGLTCNES